MPTVVLVHGAFADASGFGGIITEVSNWGYQVLAPPNPLRGLAATPRRSGRSSARLKGQSCSSAIPTAVP
jgi:hypothetical protein